MPQAITETVEVGRAYVVQNVTYGELRPLVPADGDDYTFKPLQNNRPPLIPPQWVPIQQYHSLVAEVQQLRQRVATLEKLTGEWQGE